MGEGQSLWDCGVKGHPRVGFSGLLNVNRGPEPEKHRAYFSLQPPAAPLACIGCLMQAKGA